MGRVSLNAGRFPDNTRRIGSLKFSPTNSQTTSAVQPFPINILCILKFSFQRLALKGNTRIIEFCRLNCCTCSYPAYFGTIENSCAVFSLDLPAERISGYAASETEKRRESRAGRESGVERSFINRARREEISRLGQ